MFLSSLLMGAMLSGSLADLSAPSQLVSARTLSGDELVRIGEIHDVQNHFPEALTYYGQALDAFRAHKQRKGEAVVLTKIASISFMVTTSSMEAHLVRAPLDLSPGLLLDGYARRAPLLLHPRLRLAGDEDFLRAGGERRRADPVE